MVPPRLLRRWVVATLGVLVCGALAQSLVPQPGKQAPHVGDRPPVEATITSQGIVTLDYTGFARRNGAPKASVLIYEVPPQEIEVLGDRRSVKLESIDRFLIASIKDHQFEHLAPRENRVAIRLQKGDVAKFKLRAQHVVYVALKVEGDARALTRVQLRTDPVPGNDPIVWITPAPTQPPTGDFYLDQDFGSSNVDTARYDYYLVAQPEGKFDLNVQRVEGVKSNPIRLVVKKRQTNPPLYELSGRLVFDTKRIGHKYVIWVARKGRAIGSRYEQFSGNKGNSFSKQF